MARRRKKTIQAIVSAAKDKQPGRMTTGLIVSVVITVILGGIPFGLGKYIEFNSPGPFDSGAFVYSAKHLLSGAQWGVDTHSSARPNTLLANVLGVAMFGFNETGPKLIQMLLQLGALGFMFIALRKVFGSVASVVGTTVAAIYLSAPLIAKFGNVKEQFMIPFMIAAACSFILYQHAQKRHWLILSGFFALQPYYFKPTGLSIVIAIVIFITAANLLRKAFKQLITELGLFTAGFAAGLGVPGVLYLWQGNAIGLMRTLPVVMLQVGCVFAGLILALAAIVIGAKRIQLITQLRQVSKWIWIAGLCLMAVMLIISIAIIKAEEGFGNDDIASYIHDIPMVSAPAKLVTLIDTQIDKLLRASGLQGGYVRNSWKAIGLSKLAPQIFRYYKALSVPILMALASTLTAAAIWLGGLIRKTKTTPDDIQSKLVWLLAIWWMLDMAFVWGSPRSYEQYYLPLCGSAAMLSGFVVWKWQKRLALSHNKMPWLVGGVAAAVTLSCLSIPIFIGQRYSPDTGADYVKNYGHRRRGFGPALKELPSRKQGAWVAVGEHIRTHSNEDDTMYVWGWMPGIYAQAQRLAPVSKAFEGDMHVKSPPLLKRQIDGIVNQMKDTPPKFIVDSRKRHFPNDRPPLELWPIVPPKMFGNEQQRPLKNMPQEIAAYNTAWSNMLETRIEPAEAERYEAMKPLREFLRNEYKIINIYGAHVLFERKQRHSDYE
jgi:hypothetical protein